MKGVDVAKKERPFRKPTWTVVANYVSKESDEFVGKCWQFFTEEKDAKACYDRMNAAGHNACKRLFYEKTDRQHLGACHDHLFK